VCLSKLVLIDNGALAALVSKLLYTATTSLMEQDLLHASRAARRMLAPFERA